MFDRGGGGEKKEMGIIVVLHDGGKFSSPIGDPDASRFEKKIGGGKKKKENDKFSSTRHLGGGESFSPF